MANTLYGTLDARRQRVDAELAAWNHGPERLCSLTSYPISSTRSRRWISYEKWYKKALVDAIMAKYAVAKIRAYEAIIQAVAAKTIVRNTRKLYAAV